MNESHFVSLWIGKVSSEDELEQYVRFRYDDDGALIEPQFMKDFELPRWNESLREAEYCPGVRKSASELLDGFHMMIKLFHNSTRFSVKLFLKI